MSCDDGRRGDGRRFDKAEVLYGSESGSTQHHAECVALKLRLLGLQAHARQLDEQGAEALANAIEEGTLVLFMVSTAGKGAAPFGARKFWRCLRKKSMSNHLLHDLKCSVLALGDSAYLEYNYFGKRLHNRLLGLGAQMMLPICMGNAQEEGGHDRAVDTWLDEVQKVIFSQTRDIGFGVRPVQQEELPRYDVIVHGPSDSKKIVEASLTFLKEPHEAGAAFRRLATWAPELVCGESLSEKAREVLANLKTSNNSQGEITLHIKSNEQIAGGDDIPEVRHVLFTGEPLKTCSPFQQETTCTKDRSMDENLPKADSKGVVFGTGFKCLDAGIATRDGRMGTEPIKPISVNNPLPNYSPCDCVAIYPETMREDVKQLLARLNLDAKCLVTLSLNPKHFGDGAGENPPPTAYTATLETWLCGALDIGSAAPKSSFFRTLARFAGLSHEQDRLEYLASPEGHEALTEYCEGERRTVVEILCEDFPSVSLSLPWLFHAAPRLRARLFSVASAWGDSPCEVAVTATLSSWTTPFGRKRCGLFARWIKQSGRGRPVQIEIVGADGDISSFVKKSVGRPLLMIATGAGIAPVRSFARERLLIHHHPPPTIVIFGCRRYQHDFLHELDWKKDDQDGLFQSGGAFFIACSRDGPTKLYVQHRIKEHGSYIWSVMEQEGSIFVCGGGTTGMPDAVARAIESIASCHGGMTLEEAQSWRQGLVRSHRYCVESWS